VFVCVFVCVCVLCVCVCVFVCLVLCCGGSNYCDRLITPTGCSYLVFVFVRDVRNSKRGNLGPNLTVVPQEKRTTCTKKFEM